MNLRTTLRYYYFNLDDPNQAAAYKQLVKQLKAKGLELFDSMAANHSKWYKENIKPLDGQTIELETKHLFDNQWNTAPTPTSESGLRVFDWAEAIYPNRKIKEGQWLEQTSEMRQIRREYARCQWCGKSPRWTDVHGETCPYCEQSGYLQKLTK